MGSTLLRCNSHRTRERLFSLLKTKMGKYYREPQGFFSMRTHATGGFFMVSDEYLEEARQLKGITVASSKFRYFRCWD